MTSVRELRTGLWHWQAPHPEWSDGLLGATVFAPAPYTAQDPMADRDRPRTARRALAL